MALVLPCKLKPISRNIRATVRSETRSPAAASAPARSLVDLVVHRNSDMGSPRVSGSTNADSAATSPASVWASFLRPPPGARPRARRPGAPPAPPARLPPPAANDPAAHPDEDATRHTGPPPTPRLPHHQP